jgi:hypothetical protein
LDLSSFLSLSFLADAGMAPWNISSFPQKIHAAKCRIDTVNEIGDASPASPRGDDLKKRINS